MEIIIEEGVEIVFTSAGNPKTYTSILKEKGIKVVHVVSSVKFALKAEATGVDAVVAEGLKQVDIMEEKKQLLLPLSQW